MPTPMLGGTVASLLRAILSPVDHRDLHQVPKREAVVDPHYRTARRRQAGAHGHVLVKCLVGGGALEQELLGVQERLRPLVPVVVLNLVVVPGDQRGYLGAEAMQVRIELVLSVTVAVVRER